MKIELLHFERCPGFMETLGIREKAVVEEGLAAEILPVTPAPGDWSGFPGSPTILVNGEDLFPAERGDARAASCRSTSPPKARRTTRARR